MKACLSLIFAMGLASAARAQTDLAPLIAKEPFFATWKLPDEFSIDRLQNLLQRLADEIYERGFRYMGVDEDLFHGHVLFAVDAAQERLKPFAVLYHTQEDAHAAHWKGTVDKKYDYIDVRTRNWVQWLSDHPEQDGRQIVNGREYVNEARKDPKLFYGENIPIEGEHFTIHGKNLDVNKLGVASVGELQWEFYQAKCDSAPTEYGAKGPIRVELPGQDPVCLSLTTRTVFLQYSDR